jgi:Leucine-rich repeat (LRR) protein
LKKLKAARLHKNRLRRLPESFGDLTSLEQVTLYQNELSALPITFSKLEKLQKLNIAWNRFEKYPDVLADMASLKWLATFDNPGQPGASVAPQVGRLVAQRPFNARADAARLNMANDA